MDRRDIVDDIDELVDEQLEQERSGYDHNVNQEHCPHCLRHWHGLPLTADVAAMYALGLFDPEYSAINDDSPIVCPGSTFIGPVPIPAPVQPVPGTARWTEVSRGFEADLVLFDEAAGWSDWRPKRQLAALVAWAAVFGVGVVLVFALPVWWMLAGYPVQWWALWKLVRTGRSRRRVADARQVPADDFSCTDSQELGPEWTRQYRGAGFGFNGASNFSVRVVPIERWRDDGS